MPSEVAYDTLTDRPLTAFRVTAKLNVAVPLLPSVTEGDDTDITGGPSSSVMVPVAAAALLESTALVGLDRVSVNVSLSSSSASSATATDTVLVVSPTANVSVPPAVV